MDTVYILWHMNTVDGEEDENLIGVYRSEEDAKQAIERVKDKPGFKDAPAGFVIDTYPLNKDHWEEGFIVEHW
jgi:hypothetical protein